MSPSGKFRGGYRRRETAERETLFEERKNQMNLQAFRSKNRADGKEENEEDFFVDLRDVEE